MRVELTELKQIGVNQRIYACAKASASVTFTANQSCSWFSPWQQMNWQDEFSNSKKRYASDIIIIIIRSITEAADGRDSGNEGWDEERDYKDREKQRWRDNSRIYLFSDLHILMIIWRKKKKMIFRVNVNKSCFFFKSLF